MAIYLDYAAATPVDSAAVAAMQPYLSTRFYNPSAAYQAAREVKKALEAARGAVANVLGSRQTEIIFTAGGTEANNLAINGIMEQFPDANVIVSAIEHESVLATAKQYAHQLAPVTTKGLVDAAKLAALIDGKTVLVSVMYANNEVGTIQPVKEIAEIIKATRLERQKSGNALPLYLHTDAAQAANYLDLSVSRLNIDLMTLNGGKIYAMKQSGCLYIRSGVELKPQIIGGSQESNLRPGTENVSGFITFATMLQKVQAERKQETVRLNRLRDKLIAILSQNEKSIKMNGDSKKRLPNNLNITIPRAEGERLLMELDQAGLMVATGSACTASSDEPSHVLLAMGLTKAEASASLRITLGRPTTGAELAKAAQILTTAIKQHKRLV